MRASIVASGALFILAIGCSGALDEPADSGVPGPDGGADAGAGSGADTGPEEDGGTAGDTGSPADGGGAADAGGGCGSDSDCAPDERCDGARHICYFVGCDRDSDCPGGRCRRANARCVECLGDTDCSEGTCDLETGECRSGGCTDDPLEQNDAPRAAVPLERGGAAKLVLCPGDADWFSVPLAASARLTVEFSSPTKVLVPLALYEAPGAPALSTATANQKGEIVLSQAPVAGEYLLAVGPADSALQYDLSVTVTDLGQACADDLLEDNDAPAQARPISSGEFPDLAACPKDPDFFAVSLNAGDALDALITGTGVRATLLDSAGAVLAERASAPYEFSQNAPASGDYLLRVDAAGPTAVAYSLLLDVSKAAQSCGDDPFEENDSPLSTTAIEPGVVHDAVACPEDDDWYRLSAGAVPIEVSVHGDTPPPFEVYGPWDTENPIAWSEDAPGDPSTQTISVGRPPSEVLVHVPAVEGGGPYEIRWSRKTVSCTDDRFEDDDDPAGARQITPGAHDGLMICPGDDDWFSVQLNKGDELTVTILFDSALGDLDLVLYDPAGAEAASSLSHGDIETFAFKAVQSGVFRFSVFGWDGAAAAYDMEAAVKEAVASCTDDAYEDNDDPATAAAADLEMYGLHICEGDADHFGIPLVVGERLSVGVFYDDSKGLLRAALLSTSGKTTYATGNDQQGDIILSTIAKRNAVYLLKVAGAAPAVRNGYDVLIEITK